MKNDDLVIVRLPSNLKEELKRKADSGISKTVRSLIMGYLENIKNSDSVQGMGAERILPLRKKRKGAVVPMK